MKRRINTLFFLGLFGLATAGVSFAVSYGEVVWGNKDIWWTPATLALPLSETADAFQLSVRGERLQDHLERGSLSVVDRKGRARRVSPDDVRVRLNNWHKVRSAKLHGAVLSALLLGSSLTMLVICAWQWLRGEGRGEGNNPARPEKQGH